MIFKKYYSNENESIIYFFTHLLWKGKPEIDANLTFKYIFQ